MKTFLCIFGEKALLFGRDLCYNEFDYDAHSMCASLALIYGAPPRVYRRTQNMKEKSRTGKAEQKKTEH